MEIRPFRGWRYRTTDGDVSRLIAPPFDVLSPADKASLLARDGRNIVAVDLPHVPARDAGPGEAYRSAAELLERWKSLDVLRQDPMPALYAYEQTYRWGGRTHRRRAIICAVRATELGGDVIPHEQTFAGPKADRLMLTRQTRTQLSPVFGFFDDPTGAAAEALWSGAPAEPDLRGELRGVGEKLWVITAADVIEEIASALRDLPVFIADGHHRYATALSYRGGLGDLPGDHPANFVIFVLAAMDDPGLIILPAHRVISGLKGFEMGRLMSATRKVMRYRKVGMRADDVDDADAYLRRFGPHAMALVAGDPPATYVATPTDLSVMDQLAADQSRPWRELDVSILHRLLIERHLDDLATGEMFIDYVADGRAALTAARTGRADLVVFLQATPLEAVKQIAADGGFMPHKSTYFFPKPATGMVLHPLEP